MFIDRTLIYALTSAALYWAAFPPARLSFLVFVVPVFWFRLIELSSPGKARASCMAEAPQPITEHLRRIARSPVMFYAKIWAAGALFWLAVLGWASAFEPLWTKLLWVSFSCGLAIYWPLFILTSRVAVTRTGLPAVLVMPAAWCAVEYVRKNYMLGGFSFASLEHALYRRTWLIQVADLSGEYGAGALIVFTGACLAHLSGISEAERYPSSTAARFVNSKKFAAAACVLVWVAALCYGQARVSSERLRVERTRGGASWRIALLQGNVENTPDAEPDAGELGFKFYKTVTRHAAKTADLVVWPEDSCPRMLIDFDDDFVPEGWEGQRPDALAAMHGSVRRQNREELAGLARSAGSGLLVGLVTKSFANGRPLIRHTSAVLIDDDGKFGPRYDKVNLFPFVESNPLACILRTPRLPDEWFVRGTNVPSFVIRRAHRDAASRQRVVGKGYLERPLRAAVNICFDSSFPHFIRREVISLRRKGQAPDVLINMSNGGARRLSSMHELHLATHVFRAIENRCQYVSATNSGIAAWIDTTGRLFKEGTPGEAFIVAELHVGSGTSLYQRWGDWLPVSCLCCSLGALCLGVVRGAFMVNRRLHEGRPDLYGSESMTDPSSCLIQRRVRGAVGPGGDLPPRSR